MSASIHQSLHIAGVSEVSAEINANSAKTDNFRGSHVTTCQSLSYCHALLQTSRPASEQTFEAWGKAFHSGGASEKPPKSKWPGVPIVIDYLPHGRSRIFSVPSSTAYFMPDVSYFYFPASLCAPDFQPFSTLPSKVLSLCDLRKDEAVRQRKRSPAVSAP